MTVNKTHTTRIEALEARLEDTITLVRRMKEFEDEQATHDVHIEDLHQRLSDIERKFPDLRQQRIHLDSLYTEIETVCKSVEIQRSNISGLNAYQITNDKNITLLFDRLEQLKDGEVNNVVRIKHLEDKSRDFIHIEHVVKACETWILSQHELKTKVTFKRLLKAVLYIPFTTVTKGH